MYYFSSMTPRCATFIIFANKKRDLRLKSPRSEWHPQRRGLIMTGRKPRIEWNARVTFLQSLAIAFSVCCTQSDRAAQANRENAQESVRITQFYATMAALPRGESAQLCYEVENAAAVRITPMIENIWPSLSRCVSITPTATSTFTLISENGETGKLSRSVTVTVTEPLPRFTDLSVSTNDNA